MSRGVRIAICLLPCWVAIQASMPAAQAADPPVESATTFQIDAAHDGNVQAAEVSLPFKRVWSMPVTSASYPIIAQGMVIVTASGGPSMTDKILTAFDAKDGHQLWTQQLSGAYGYSNAAYDHGRVFAVTDGGGVQAFDAATGASEWATQTETLGAPPTAVGGTLFVDTYNKLYALDEATGTSIWRASGGGSKGAPTIVDGSVVVSGGCEETYATNLDGSARWHYQNGCTGGGGNTDVWWDDRVYVRDVVQGDVTLDGGSGDQLGAFATDQIPAFDDFHMFTVVDGSINANALAGGTVDWTAGTDIVTPPLIMSDWLIAGTSDGDVSAFDRATGEVVWHGTTGSPIVAPDEWNVSVPITGLGAAGPLLVVPTGDHLVAFRAQGPWTIAGMPPTVGAGATGAAGASGDAGGTGVAGAAGHPGLGSAGAQGNSVVWPVALVVLAVLACGGALTLVLTRRDRANVSSQGVAGPVATAGAAGGQLTPPRPDIRG